MTNYVVRTHRLTKMSDIRELSQRKKIFSTRHLLEALNIVHLILRPKKYSQIISGSRKEITK